MKLHSPSELIKFMERPFALWMDRYAVHFPEILLLKDKSDALTNILQKRGLDHEFQLEEWFKNQNLTLIKIEGKNDTEKKEATLLAMKQGIDVIGQARLENNDFMGYSDFLKKVPGKSKLGEYHYEVWDTKLSKQLKASYVIQLCCYAEMLETMQGVRPENIVVVLGNENRETLRTNDFYHYYLKLKESFLDDHSNFNPNEKPDPANFKDWGHWSTHAEQLLTEQDHLFQIANITRGQIKKLNQSEIHTMQCLIETDLPRIPKLNDITYNTLKKQAGIQKKSRGQPKPSFQVIVPEEDVKQGLALLPPSSPLDVFFDIEGFPFYEDGLEYLWGCTYFNESGERVFKDFWAHDREEEKKAFEDFIHWVYKRWQQDPTMHIYHYANYEIAACRKLMGRFGVCEEEVDQLLRNEVFVDLYKVVKGSILLGEPRYSIKNVERLYREKRKTEVGSGGDSVAVYENWRELHQLGEQGRTWETSTILKSIRDYNIDDCDSTQELVQWLRELQKEHNIAYLGKTEVETPDVKEEFTERTNLRDRLLEKAMASPPKEAQLLENLAGVLEFHQRESKPVFWRLFDRLGNPPEVLFDDQECLAFCERTSKSPFKPTPKSRNLAYEYRFDPTQEFKGLDSDNSKNKYYLFGEKNKNGKQQDVTLIDSESDLENGIIVVQSEIEPKQVISLIPNDYVTTDIIADSITQFVKDFETGLIKKSAILDFLNRAKPSIKGHTDGPIITNEQNKLEQTIQAVENLDNSYLTIQGPPGTGKTYTAKHIIAKLVQSGYKIGIASNSHKAINNLLLETVKYCHKENIKATFVCTKDTDPILAENGVLVTTNPNLSDHLKPSCVLGSTAWGFSNPKMADQLDYLFIDEAGQVSVANLIGMSRSARNLVLMGDQMQLSQPTQGTHPSTSGLSTLDYLLHNSPTISPDMGVFLETTYRMHPDITAFISDNIYDGKLKSAPSTQNRIIKLPTNYQGKLNKESGILFIPVHHEGNTQSSDEEIAEILTLTKELLTRNITFDDILFLTPYNYQYLKLKNALGPQAKVGTIDKFQGQEAPVMILSMCTSDPAESSRGLDFLLNKNRLNVAISRAQSLAIIVANPSLATTPVSNIDQLKLVNLFIALTTHT